MYIGLIIYGSLDTISGGYLYDRQLVGHLRGEGNRVDVVSLPWGNYGRFLTQNLSLALYHHLHHTPFDILLQDELNHPSLFLLNRWLRRRVSYPIISIVHHLRCSEARPTWQNGFYRWVERLYLQTADSFIFNSQTTRQVVESLGVKRPFVVAYPAGDRFQPALTPAQMVARAHQPGPLRLLFVGNLIPRKGLHLLIEALAHLPRGEYQLAVVGNTAVSPAYTAHIHAQLKTAELTPYVTLHNTLPDAQLANQFAHSHVLVVPSSYEGFGIVYLEGMAFGLPAIAGIQGAAHEMITEGENGWLVVDSAVLAHRLHTLHTNRFLLAAMSQAAHNRYLAHPTWQHSMAQISTFLHNHP